MNRAIVFSFALAASACKKTPPPAPVVVADAGAKVDAELPLVVVAEGTLDTALAKTLDGRIVVFAGPMLYEGKADGTLEPVMTPSEIAPLVEDDDNIVGYAVTRELRNVSGSFSGTLLLESATPTTSSKFHTWRARHLAPVDALQAAVVVYREHLLVWDYVTLHWVDGAQLPAPIVPAGAGISLSTIAAGPSDTLIAEAGDSDKRSLVVWKADSEVARVVPFPDDTHCSVAPSFAARILLECDSKAWALDANGFVAISPKKIQLARAVSQDANGDLYSASISTLMRCPLGDAPCTTRVVPKTDARRVPSYERWRTDFARSEDITQNWQALAVVTRGDPYDKFEEVSSVLARSPNDVWIARRRQGRVQILHPRATPLEQPMILPSTTDARVAVRNARPPQPWTSPCDQLYVRIGGDGEAIAKRERDIEKAVGVKEDAPSNDWPEWSLVEGRLGDEKSAGVILSRRDPTQKIAVLEKAANRLADAFAKGGANRPAVFCTLPVLERRLLPKD